MSVVVSIRDVVNEMAELSERQTAFLNRRTGELFNLDDRQRAVLENGHLPQELSDWEQQLQALNEAGDLLELPSSFEHHEYSVVEKFCDSIRDGEKKRELLKAIHGRQAFRDFKAAVQRLGIQEQWKRVRDQAFEQIAIGWLERNEIAYE